MLKCKYCGASLTLKDERCPYCGRINEAAASYVEDHKKYKKDFETTGRKVHTQSNYALELRARGITLIVMVVIFFVLVVVGIMSDDWFYKKKQNKAVDNFEQVSDEMQSYWEKGQYEEFLAYCDAYNLSGWTAGPFLKYHPQVKAAQCYTYINSSILQYLESSKEYKKSEQLESICGLLANLYDESYMCYDAIDVIDEQETHQELTQIYDDMGAIMQTYFPLTEADTVEFRTMTEDDMILRIEQRMEEANEQ